MVEGCGTAGVPPPHSGSYVLGSAALSVAQVSLVALVTGSQDPPIFFLRVPPHYLRLHKHVIPPVAPETLTPTPGTPPASLPAARTLQTSTPGSDPDPGIC